MLFNKYSFTKELCMTYKIFTYLLISEVKNNESHEDSQCEYCMSGVKYEIKQFYSYLDANASGLIGAEELFSGMRKFETGTDFEVTASMVNAFVIMNDHTQPPKRKVSREEFVNGILLGMAERLLTSSGFNHSEPHRRNARESVALSGNGPQ